MNIFLVGPMGSGKSSLGKKLAKSLDKKFIDKDKEIEKKENKVIFLNASVERQSKRTSRSDKRPLLKNVDRLKKLRELYYQRLEFYKEVSNFEINVDKYKSKDILMKIIEELNE